MLRRTVIALITLTAFASIAEEKSVPQDVRFHRPFQPGHLFSLASIAGTHREVQARWAGSLLENRVYDLQCEMAASFRIIKVDSDGLPSEVKLTVFRFGKREGEKLIPLLEKGTIVIARRNEEPRFQFFIEGNKPAEGELAEALELLVAFDTENLDPVFGVAQPKKPGDRWAVDPRQAALRFARNGILVDPEKLGSVVRFRGHDEVGGQACQLIHTEMRASSASPELPEGMHHFEGSLEVEIETKLPLDESLPRIEEAIQFTLHSKARGEKSEAAVQVETRVTTTIRTRVVRP